MGQGLLFAAALAALGVGLAGCHEEPPIVVKFEPNDLSGAHADLARAPVADGGATRAAADAGKTAEEKTTAEAMPKGSAHECKTAADCTVAPAECCDCANGGKQIAIPKREEAKLKAARQKRCKHTMCTMMLSLDPTCGKTADCVGGRCVLVEKKNAPPPRIKIKLPKK